MAQPWLRIFLIVCVSVFANGIEIFIQYDESHVAAAQTFKIWQLQHNKFYSDPLEEARRYRIFYSNLKRINKLNQQFRYETVYALNQFADLSPDEFKSIYLMPDRSPVKFEESRYMTSQSEGDLPQSFDWSTQGKVTSVKNQGSAGSCWAFSAVENIEGQWAMKGHTLTNFSVEQVVDCDDSEDIPKKHADCGIFGGWPYLAYGYIQRQGGLESEKDYPYCSGGGGVPGTCFVCPAPKYNKTLCGPPVPWCNVTCGDKLDRSKFVPGLNVTGWKALPTNETQIAELLTKVGPLSIALDATLLQFYLDGVFNPIYCSKTELNHAVLATGFGTKKTIFGSKEDYWIIKNSWGEKWGKKGYFWIKRGSGTCGVNTAVTTATIL